MQNKRPIYTLAKSLVAVSLLTFPSSDGANLFNHVGKAPKKSVATSQLTEQFRLASDAEVEKWKYGLIKPPLLFQDGPCVEDPTETCMRAHVPASYPVTVDTATVDHEL